MQQGGTGRVFLEIQLTCRLFHLPQDILFKWLFDPITSRIIEMFFVSETVLPKSKKKMMHSLQGQYGGLAKDKYGSHLIDKIWLVAPIALKETIAEELLTQERDILNDFHGKFVARNVKLDLFKRRRQEWREMEQGAQTRKALFKDFL